MVRSTNEPEPVPLQALIASRPRPGSTPLPTPTTVCKIPGRKEPVRSVRPRHPRGREGIRPDLLTVCRELAGGLRPWPLYLWSPGPGTGKTSAALTLLDHYGPVRHGVTYSDDVGDFMFGFSDFASLPELFRGAEKGRYHCSTPHSCEALWASDLWSWIKAANLLVVDDVRRPGPREQRLGDDHYGLLKRILDERIGRGLVITSNLNPFEIDNHESELVATFDDRVGDRIMCGTVFKLNGPSRRGE